MMILRVSNRVLLVLHILLAIQDLVMCQNRFDIDDTEDLDIPLLSKLDAPLKATLDISELNKQLTALIDKKVNAGVKKALENLVHKTIEKRIQVTQGEIVAWNNNTLGTLQNKLEEQLESKLKPVAFYAYRSSDIITSSSIKHKQIMYDVVDLNIGSGYDVTSGKFKAPLEGLYLFHASTGVINRSWATIELIHNGKIKDIGWPDSGDHNDRNHVTTATPLNLKGNDVVYVRIGDSNGGRYIESNQLIRTSFSGVKII